MPGPPFSELLSSQTVSFYAQFPEFSRVFPWRVNSSLVCAFPQRKKEKPMIIQGDGLKLGKDGGDGGIRPRNSAVVGRNLFVLWVAC